MKINNRDAYNLRSKAVLILRQQGFKIRELAAVFRTTPDPIRRLEARGLRIEIPKSEPPSQ